MPSTLVLAALVIVVVLALTAASRVLLQKRTPRISNAYPYQTKEYLLTKAENSFDGVLTRAIGDEYRICPKVRVADVLTPKPFHKSAFNAVAQKHFDWILLDPKTSSILCAIELDDSSHNSEKNIKRDSFLATACRSAGLNLIRFPAKHTYSEKDVATVIRNVILTPA